MAIKWFILATLVTIANGQFGFPNFGGAVNKGIQSAAKPTGINVPKIPLSPEELLNNQWTDFGAQFNKTYATPALAEIGKQNFIANGLSIQKLSEGLSGFTLKLNQFADLVLDEFNKIFNGFKGGNLKDRKSGAPKPFQAPTEDKLPESVDWRERGGVTPVKYQGQCASCHAFSAAGAVEGHHFRKSGVLIELSPQNLLDCPKTLNYQSFGCTGGGYVDEDLKYIWKNPGINRLESYTYEGTDKPCKYDKNHPEVTITGYVEIPEGDEKALEEVVATLGPVAVGIDAGHTSFQFYSEGVYYDKECKNKGENINHAVLVVGYGKEADGTKYWLVKNSYGTQWGMDGYVKIAKDKDNHCGIATSAVYPLV